MNMRKIVLFIFIVFTFTLCTNNTNVKELKITYMDEYINTATSLECNEVFGFVTEKKVVTGKKTLKKISKIMSELVDTCNNSIDARISCLVIYGNNSSDTLCLGARWGARLNGKPICDNKELFKLMRELIYPDDFLAIRTKYNKENVIIF